MKRVAFLLLPITLACSAPSSVERQADAEVSAGRWAEAVAGYRQAAAGQADGRVVAKLGSAELHAGHLREAAAAYTRLGREDPSRQDEAADGLEVVARAAERGVTPPPCAWPWRASGMSLRAGRWGAMSWRSRRGER